MGRHSMDYQPEESIAPPGGPIDPGVPGAPDAPGVPEGPGYPETPDITPAEPNPVPEDVTPHEFSSRRTDQDYPGNPAHYGQWFGSGEQAS